LAWAKEMKKRVEQEIIKKEIEATSYWEGEVERIISRRPDSLAAFRLEIQNLLQRMKNRIRVLQNSLGN